MDKTLYALPTTHCNLSCPHCDIKNTPEGYDRDLFVDALTNFDGRVILFGGEPTLYEDRLFDIIDADSKKFNRIRSISTNLIKLSDRLIQFYKKLGGVSTSWNPSRFTESEYATWISNCEVLNKEKIKANIMITLTDDLFAMPIDQVLDMINTWNPNLITDINFEHYVGDNGKEYYTRADDWLCEIYTKWNSPIKNKTIVRIQDWYYDCSGIYTLTPNGIINDGCPHHSEPTVLEECFSCEKASVCRPCRLQKQCSYPKKFADMILNQGGEK